MKKKLSLLWTLTSIVCLSVPNATAQVSDSFYLKMAHIFQHVEPNRITTGLLKDYGIDFTEMQDYDGIQVSDTNIVYVNTWDDLYTSLYTYRFNNVMAGMSHPDTVFKAIRSAQTNDLIPLSLLLMRYDTYLDNAATAGLVTITGDQIFDKYVGGVWQNPYQQKTAMGVRASANIIRKQSMVFRLPAALVYSNFSNIQSIQADFADGLGWRTITTNTDIPVSYADTGRKVLQFRVTLTTSQQYISRTAIGVYPEETSAASARFLEHLSIPIPSTANHSGGTLQVHFSAANFFTQTITRPLIIAEGFDPWKYTSGDVSANTDFDDFWRARFVYGAELRELLSDDYDIIYLDYNDGTDLISKNAALLTEAINEVNARKATAGSLEPNVVLGISMGGLVSRMALRQMELNAQDHQTRLFVSLDAPYQGANVPLGLQALNAHLASTQIKVGLISGTIGYVTTVGSLENSLKVYSSPAAKQLLTYYVKSDLLNGNLSMDNTVHNAFVNTLKTLGYPVNCRNVAISNGSECAESLPVSPGSDLMRLSGNFGTTILGALALPMIGLTPGTLTNYPQFLIDFFPGPSAIKCNFVIKTTPASGSAQVYNGRVWLEKKILFIINVNQTLTSNSYNSPSGILPLDAYPGGQYAVNEVGQVLMENFGGDFGTSFWQEIQNKMMKKGISEFYMASPSFTFTPTPHVLDIGQSNVTLAASDYTMEYRATSPPVAPKNTPFANFLTAFNGGQVENELHVYIEDRSGSWFAAELNGLPEVGNCAAFCNQSIAGPSIFCDEEQYSVTLAAGTNVTWQVNPAGIVNVAPSGSQVTLTRIVNGNFTLTANITGACGTFQINRNISIFPVDNLSGTVYYIDRTSGMTVQFPASSVNGVCPQGEVWLTPDYMATVTNVTQSNSNFPNTWWFDSGGIHFFTDFLNFDQWPSFQVTYSYGCAASIQTFHFWEDGCMAPFMISPNPASGKLTIISVKPQANSPAPPAANAKMAKIPQQAIMKSSGKLVHQVILLDITGREVVRKVIAPTSTYTLNISEVPAGIYLVKIFDGKSWSVRKVIVQ